MQDQLRTAAHDLRNLANRLSLLSENLQRELPSSPVREEARSLLADTTERLHGIADRLRGLSPIGG